MAGSVNKVILVGNLGRDPEIRAPRTGADRQPVGRHHGELARQGSGERKQKTEWHRVVIFNEGLAKIAENI